MCVCLHSAGGCECVWQPERLSLVGGGVVRHCGLPSLSCHQGCEKQIKLSFLLPFSTSPSCSHPLISTLVFFFFCKVLLLGSSSAPPNFQLYQASFTIFFFYCAFIVHFIVDCIVQAFQSPRIIAFQNKIRRVTWSILFQIQFLLTA